MDKILKNIAKKLIVRKLTVSTAESCTGGLVASILTDVSGSSNYFKGGFVVYSNWVKERLLMVNRESLMVNGEVSEEVATSMVKNLRKIMKTDICISTTGYLGPTGGTKESPVGTVYIAILYRGKIIVKRLNLAKNLGRERLKNLATLEVLRIMAQILKIKF